MQRWEEVTLHLLPDLGAAQHAGITRSLSALRYKPSSAWLAAAWQALPGSMRAATTLHPVADLLHAIAAAQWPDPPAAFQDAAAERLALGLQPSNAGQLASTQLPRLAWAAARLQLRLPSQLLLSLAEALVAPGAARHAAPREQQHRSPLQQASSFDMALAVWGLARLGTPPQPAWLLAVEQQTAARLQLCDSQALATLAGAFAQLRHAPGERWRRQFLGCSRAQLPGASPRTLASMAWAMARLRLSPRQPGVRTTEGWTEAFLQRTGALLAQPAPAVMQSSGGSASGSGGGAAVVVPGGGGAAAAAAAAAQHAGAAPLRPATLSAAPRALVRPAARPAPVSARPEAAARLSAGGGQAGVPWGARSLARVACGLAELGIKPGASWQQAWRAASQRQVANMGLSMLVGCLWAQGKWAALGRADVARGVSKQRRGIGGGQQRRRQRRRHAGQGGGRSSSGGSSEGGAPPGAGSVEQWLEAVLVQTRDRLPSCTPGQLVGMLVAVGRLGVLAPALWLDAACDSMWDHLPAFSPRQLAAVLSALAKQQHAVAEARLDALLGAMVGGLGAAGGGGAGGGGDGGGDGGLGVHVAAKALSALAAMEYLPNDEGGLEGLLQAAGASLVGVQHGSARAAATAAAAAAPGGVRDVHAAAPPAAVLRRRLCRSLPALLSGAAALGLRPSAAWLSVLGRVTLRQAVWLSASQLASLLWAASMLGWRPARPLLQRLLLQLRRRLAGLQPHQFALVGMALAALRLQPAAAWRGVYVDRALRTAGAFDAADRASLMYALAHLRAGGARLAQRQGRRLLQSGSCWRGGAWRRRRPAWRPRGGGGGAAKRHAALRRRRGAAPDPAPLPPARPHPGA
jgi:hypothetical protein